MKRIGLILVVMILLLGVGIVAADPGPNNPHRGEVLNVSCADGRYYDRLTTVGLSPWFDPNGTTVSSGPTRVERLDGDQWVLLFDLPGQGVPTTFCTWMRGDTQFRGDVQFFGPH